MEASENTQAPGAATAEAAIALFFIGPLAVAPASVVIAPYSFVTIVPALLAASVLGEKWLIAGAVLGATISPIGYVLVARYIPRTGKTMPNASVIGFTAIAILSLAYAAGGWDLTVRYTSVTRAAALVMQAVIPALLVALAGISLRNTLTVRRSLVNHWVAFAWLSWSAFPWYGELM